MPPYEAITKPLANIGRWNKNAKDKCVNVHRATRLIGPKAYSDELSSAFDCVYGRFDENFEYAKNSEYFEIEDEIKQHRSGLIMERQYGVLFSKQESRVGTVMKVIVDGFDDENMLYMGRTYMDAPEIDTNVIISTEDELFAGQLVKIKTSYGNYTYEITNTAVKRNNDRTAFDLSADEENLIMYKQKIRSNFKLRTFSITFILTFT